MQHSSGWPRRAPARTSRTSRTPPRLSRSPEVIPIETELPPSYTSYCRSLDALLTSYTVAPHPPSTLTCLEQHELAGKPEFVLSVATSAVTTAKRRVAEAQAVRPHLLLHIRQQPHSSIVAHQTANASPSERVFGCLTHLVLWFFYVICCFATCPPDHQPAGYGQGARLHRRQVLSRRAAGRAGHRSSGTWR